MNQLLFTVLLIASIGVFAQNAFDYKVLTYSQVGYDKDMPKTAMLQHADSSFFRSGTTFTLRQIADNKKVITEKIIPMGEKWKKFWWKVDFSRCKNAGEYYLQINYKNNLLYESKKELPIIIAENLLWNKTWQPTALYHLHLRDSLSYKPEGGWKDCGSTLQEISSHVIMLNALCDLLELSKKNLSPDNQQEIYNQLVIGANYVALCQDKAKSLGLGDGAVVHEVRRNLKVVTGNVAKTAMILARISRLLKDVNPELSVQYKARSVRAYTWIAKNGHIIHWEDSDFYAITHGAPYGIKIPPKEWMTRDLVMMMWASVELYKCGELEYKQNAIDYAVQIMARQVRKEKAEGGLYGHFYTYNSYDFTEKANIHCGAWDANYKAYNQGGHFPHYLIPMIEMMNLWPENQHADSWKKCVHNFAYHYFLPATNQNPFKILPAGYYKNEGLLNWSGWYHGHNKIFGYAAGLAMEFYHLYKDPRFIEIAVGNMQWIAGLHSGFHQNNDSFSASMIVGIGNRSKADWDAMRGTITNGFDADPQFKLTRPSKETDLPTFFGDEGGIHHPAGWISGLTRLYCYFKK